MIRLTTLETKSNTEISLFIIAGGPGLSSQTLRSLDLLKDSCRLVYLDFGGTGESVYSGKQSYDEIISHFVKTIERNKSKKNYILGHSFGGILASSVFIHSKIDGLVCLSVPFTKSSLSNANENYMKFMTPELKIAESEWVKNQDDISFASWLSEYGQMYFCNPEGKLLIAKDKVSSKYFKDNRSDAANKEYLLNQLRETNRKKIFVCGKEDKLISSDFYKKDAEQGGFDFHEIDEASHFVSFDQPEKVKLIIEQSLINNKGDSL